MYNDKYEFTARFTGFLLKLWEAVAHEVDWFVQLCWCFNPVSLSNPWVRYWILNWHWSVWHTHWKSAWLPAEKNNNQTTAQQRNHSNTRYLESITTLLTADMYSNTFGPIELTKSASIITSSKASMSIRPHSYKVIQRLSSSNVE